MRQQQQVNFHLILDNLRPLDMELFPNLLPIPARRDAKAPVRFGTPAPGTIRVAGTILPPASISNILKPCTAINTNWPIISIPFIKNIGPGTMTSKFRPHWNLGNSPSVRTSQRCSCSDTDLCREDEELEKGVFLAVGMLI